MLGAQVDHAAAPVGMANAAPRVPPASIFALAESAAVAGQDRRASCCVRRRLRPLRLQVILDLTDGVAQRGRKQIRSSGFEQLLAPFL